MNKYLIPLLTLLTLAWTQARGADTLPELTASVEEIRNGQEWILHISMNNPEAGNLTAIQMDCHLPEGISYVEGSAATSIRLTDHSVYTGQQPDGSLRLALLSLSNSAIAGTEGEIISLRLRSENLLEPGKYTLSINNVNIVERDGSQMRPAMFQTTLVSSPAVEATYTLTYLVDGTVYTTQTYKAGDTVTPPAAPTREGYTFTGWTDLPATMPEADISVTAGMSINTYTITYYVDGKVYTTQQVEYGQPITPPEGPTREGYTFTGWTDLPTTMPATDISVTAGMSINTYTITYYVDGEVYTTQQVEYGQPITPPEDPTREGYTFTGWTDLPTTMPATDINIYGTMQQETGIRTANAADSDAGICDLQGRRVNRNKGELPRGIYIIGGRKVLVK